MREAAEIVNDILVMKFGDKNAVGVEMNRLTKIITALDDDIAHGMLSNQESLIYCLQKQASGAEIGKTTLSMLNAVFKTLSAPKSISMLGKLLFAENAVQDDYTLILLYRLLEQAGLTIKAIPKGYNALRGGISRNKLLDYAESINTETTRELTDSDLLKALFILNDEPDEDIALVEDCGALLEYKRIISEVKSMNGVTFANIPDYTTYPNMVLVMGLNVLANSGKSIEIEKDTLERLVTAILTKKKIDELSAGF